MKQVGLLRAEDKKVGSEKNWWGKFRVRGKKYSKSWHHGKTMHTLNAIQYHAPKWLQGAKNKVIGTKSGIGGVKKDGKG